MSENGKDNLVPFNKRTENEQREIARKGGKTSGEARRRKKNQRQVAEMVLNLKPKLPEQMIDTMHDMGLETDDETTIRLVSTMVIANKAMKGDIQSMQFLLEMTGEDAASKAVAAKLAMENKKLKAEITAASGLQNTQAMQQQVQTIASLINNPQDDRELGQ